MKQIITLVLFFQIGWVLQAQKLTSDYIQKHTYYFSIEDGKIKGEGKKVFKEMIQNSQFINYGEIHGSKEVSIISKAMMPLLKEGGYRHFAIEVGPHSAEKLSQLSSDPSKTVANLYAFNSAYSVSEGGETAEPIPFFTNVSDAEFLGASRAQGMDLWGLDQEYYYAAFFLMDEMLASIKDTPGFAKVQKLKMMAQGAMLKHYMAEVQDKIDDPFPLILKEPAVINFFNAFDSENTKAKAIVKDLKISWDIYSRWRNGSHQDRISYMRNNFIKYYKHASKTEKRPKVFTKIGSLHAPKLLSNNAFDIGSLTEELAQKNGTYSSSINTWVPFSKTDKGIVKNIDRYRSYKRYAAFLKLAKQDQFAIIDLKSIRQDISKGKVKLPTNGDYHALRSLLFGYDYQIMLPISEKTVPNRKQ